MIMIAVANLNRVSGTLLKPPTTLGSGCYYYSHFTERKRLRHREVGCLAQNRVAALSQAPKASWTTLYQS